MKKIDNKFIKQSFEKEGYILLDEYKNATTKMKYICPNGHEHSIDWHHFKSGKRCPYCAIDKTKKNFEEIKESFKNKGWILLEDKYINSSYKMKCICPNGHEHSISWNSFQRGKGCPYCYGHNKLTIEFIKEEFNKIGWTLLTTEYINEKQKLEYICNNGHKHSIRWNKFKKGQRCPECSGTKLSIDFIRKEFENIGWMLLTDKYVNSKQKLEYMCDKGHEHSICWDNFKQGYRCPECNVSKGEKRIQDVLNCYKIKYIYNTTIWDDNSLKPDFYLPKYNLVIEYDGIQHFEPIEYFGGEEKLKYQEIKDEEKNTYCEEHNIDILRIPYWNFDNIENILKQKLNLE